LSAWVTNVDYDNKNENDNKPIIDADTATNEVNEDTSNETQQALNNRL
jgi:hypothetical protein